MNFDDIKCTRDDLFLSNSYAIVLTWLAALSNLLFS